VKVRSPELIVIEGLANEVSHVEWYEMEPAAKTLKKGIDIARTAVIQAREAETLEQWIAARKIARRALSELSQSVVQSDIIELQARRAEVTGIGSPGVWEWIKKRGRAVKNTAKKVGRAVVNSCKAGFKVLKDATNKMVMKISEMTGLAKKVRAERAATAGQLQELRAISPRVKDPKIRLNITKLEADFAKLDAKTKSKLQEAKTQEGKAVGEVKRAKALKPGEEIEIKGIGHIGHPSPAIFIPVAIAAGAAAVIIAMTVLLTSWSKAKANATALTEQAKADADLADEEKTRLEQNKEIRDLAVTESEKLGNEADELRKEASEAQAKGDTGKANLLLKRAADDENEAIAILKPHLKPQEPLRFPRREVPKEEPKKLTGLSAMLGFDVKWLFIGGLAVLILPHIIPMITRAIPKPKALPEPKGAE